MIIGSNCNAHGLDSVIIIYFVREITLSFLNMFVVMGAITETDNLLDGDFEKSSL